ncbi:NAD(P)-dependent oxidoreductase [Anaerovorax odorimutans]|uniref:NAD(P)-dependent oxidoreductase n=1 Tax=Anaerovorax odorimutans TaxID=109327 RepID=A0ABT1RSX8_9FIRM|nr:NAD(P)-dependent oxidoreductase [Anaerovorax odorimutans]MCQ4638282.1 NAD(P)-dependent oxidoreductase [Anaerovorax odorimutans]
MSNIGWIGLGNMGNPMCKNLVKAGHEVTVWNRTKSKAKDVLAMGAAWETSPKAVAQKADYIFIMVSNGAILKKVVLGENGICDGLTEGKIVIDMSTVSPEESLPVNEAVKMKKCRFLRSPVTGSVVPAEKGLLGLLLSGDRTAFEEVEPVLDVLGKNKYWIGAKEEARVMKIALNTMVGNTTQLLAEAVTLAEKAGINVETCMEVISGSAVGNLIVQSKIDAINEGKYEPAFSVKMMLKDFDLALDAAKQYETSLPVTALTRQFYEETVASGRGDEDYAVLVKRLEENVGINR